jgi:pilus assembly protein CpaB
VTFGVMAIVLGLVAAYIVRQALQKPPVVATPAPAPEMVQVVFARNVIAKHTRLTAGDVFVASVPKGSKLLPGTFRGINLVEGRVTKDTIAAGKVLREEHLMGLDESLPDLAERIPAGHRAVTIVIQGTDTGGKRLAEGDHIDIAMTVEGSHPDLGEVMTRTLMRNVLIVDAAAGRPVVRTNRRGIEQLSSTITVAVTPADANKLIVAQRSGTLQATLVSALDAAAPAGDDAVSRRQLLGLKQIVPPRKFTIEKWSGSDVRVIEMSDERIQESRNAPGSKSESPVARPAPAPGDVSRNLDSGVLVPELTVTYGEEAAAVAAAPPAAQ